MKRPRLTVRRWMIAVALLGFLIWLEVWRRRSIYCEENIARCQLAERSHRQLAEDHGRISSLYRKLAANRNESVRYYSRQAGIFDRAGHSERLEAEGVAERVRVYRRAAFLPWVALPPPEGGPQGI
jgi:hypothetical protein